MANNYHYLFKYIIIGDSSVGKSNILMKFAHNKFSDEYQATIGVEFGAKNIEIDSRVYRIQIWDTAGQENFRSITRSYYKNSVCALVVYDVTKKKSFENVQKWIQDVQAQSPKTILIFLVGNKIDLEEQRVISFDEGNNFAAQNGIRFTETSAKTGEGIEELFKMTVEHIVKNMDNNYYDLKSEICGIKIGTLVDKKAKNKHKNNEVKLNNTNDKEKKKCC